MRRRARGAGSVGPKPGKEGLYARWPLAGGGRGSQKVAKGQAEADWKLARDRLDALVEAEEARAGRAMPTFAQFVTSSYAEEYAGGVTEETAARTAGILRAAGEAWAGRGLDEIDRGAVKRYLAKLKTQGLSNATRRKVLWTLSPVFDEAIEVKLIKSNPCRGSRARRIKIPMTPPLPAPEVTPAQFAQLLEVEGGPQPRVKGGQFAAGAGTARYADVLLLIVDTGLRRLPAVMLRRHQVSRDCTHLLNVPVASVKTVVPSTPLTQRCRAMLRRRLDESTDDRVFPDVTVEGLRQHFDRLRVRVGLPHLTLRGLRKRFLVDLLLEGTHPSVVSGLAGHADAATLARHYAKLLPTEAERAAGKALERRARGQRASRRGTRRTKPRG